MTPPPMLTVKHWFEHLLLLSKVWITILFRYDFFKVFNLHLHLTFQKTKNLLFTYAFLNSKSPNLLSVQAAWLNVGTLWSYRPLWSLKLIRFSQKWLWYPQIPISLPPCSALCKRLKWLIVKCFVFLIFISFVQLTKFHFCSWVRYDNNNNLYFEL